VASATSKKSEYARYWIVYASTDLQGESLVGRYTDRPKQAGADGARRAEVAEVCTSHECVARCNIPVPSYGRYASLRWLLDGEAYKSESGGASACGC
jgi:hypothetical protein